MENEVVSLRRKLQSKDIKWSFDKTTKIMDHIISNQRPIYDKSGLRYNHNNAKMGSSTKIIENDKRSYTQIVRESTQKKGSEPLKEDKQNLEMKKNKEDECAWRKSSTTHNNDLRRPTLARRPFMPRYQFFFPWCVLCLQ